MNQVDPRPPRLADWILSKILKKELLEEILGDLEEKFLLEYEGRSALKAKINYWYQVLNYLRPFAMKRSIIINSNNTVMFRNNIKIAWRSMLRQKTFSSIKIGGFAIGIAACVLITLFIKDELSYEENISENELVYRVLLNYQLPVFTGMEAYTHAPLAEFMKQEFPEVQEAGRWNTSTLFRAGGNEVRTIASSKSIHEEKVAYMDQGLLNIIQPEMVEGNLTSALSQPNTIVISKSKAEQYFPRGNALGETLILNNDTSNPYKIGGVMQDFPKNSHFNTQFIISLKDREFWDGEQTNWVNTNYFTYLKLNSGATLSSLENKLSEVIEERVLPLLKQEGYVPEGAWPDALKFELQALNDIHLMSADISDNQLHGDISLVRMFGVIAVFILLLACVNFINLSTAKSANRGKEVGLRKTLGSLRQQLMGQFLTESILMSMLSFVLGIILAWLTLPYFNSLSGKSLGFPISEWWLIPSFISVAVVVGLISGIYPSIYLSSFKPIQVLKGNLTQGVKSSKLRNGLVIFQFTTAVILIFGTLVVTRQMNFILNKNLGFDKDQVVLIQGTHTLWKKLPSFKEELKKIPGVQNVTVSDYLPVRGADIKRNGYSFWLEGQPKGDGGVPGQFWQVDEDYINTLKISVSEGRDFIDEVGNNVGKAIINQTLKAELGIEEISTTRLDNGDRTYEIVGVVQDFHFESLREEIRGACLIVNDGTGDISSVVAIRTKSPDISGLMASVESTWDTFNPNQPLRYTFLDERFETMYEEVKRTGNIVSSFSILAIAVACLGLFGLSAFIAEQRGKEMSIRKVLGASVSKIFNLLTIDFLKLILISLIIALPLAWYGMQQWLEDFAYRTEISWWVYIIAGVLAILVALLTISKQALKVAFSNPAESLRNE